MIVTAKPQLILDVIGVDRLIKDQRVEDANRIHIELTERMTHSQLRKLKMKVDRMNMDYQSWIQGAP